MKPNKHLKHQADIDAMCQAIGGHISASFDGYRAMIATLVQLGDITEDQADIVWNKYAKAKVLKFDRVNRRYVVKHGALLDRETIQANARG